MMWLRPPTGLLPSSRCFPEFRPLRAKHDGPDVRGVDLRRQQRNARQREGASSSEEIDLAAAEEFDAEEEEVLEHAADLSIAELAKLPESQTLEFKSAMRYDLRTGGTNRALEQVIVKSVAGLMNARGGVLLIGVADDGGIIGIDKDVEMLPRRQALDAYENHLTTLLENGIGAAATSNAEIRVEQADGKAVCRIAAKPSTTPVWTKLKGQEDCFFVRLGNSTRPLGPRETHEYITQHFQ